MEWIIIYSVIIYLIIINIVAFAVYGADKKRAEMHRFRISESCLIWLAVLGGSVGALEGMKVFHHKTRHRKFAIGIPVILFIQMALAVVIWLCVKGMLPFSA